MGDSNKITTAMILAAGRGTRMGNLSRRIPKPLLKMGGYSLLEIALRKLRRAGFRKVVVNVHHLAEQLEEFLENFHLPGLEILVSEEDELLGTGGGIAQAERFFAGETILVLNSDVLCDISLSDLLQFHRRHTALATMAVVPSRDYHHYRLVRFNSRGRLLGFHPKGESLPTAGRFGIFTGFQVLTPAARRYLQPRPSSVIDDFYLPSLQEGEEIAVFVHRGRWLDVGTEALFRQVQDMVVRGEVRLEDFM